MAVAVVARETSLREVNVTLFLLESRDRERRWSAPLVDLLNDLLSRRDRLINFEGEADRPSDRAGNRTGESTRP